MPHKTFITCVLLLATSVVLARTQHSHIQDFHLRSIHNERVQYNQAPRFQNCHVATISCVSTSGNFLAQVMVPTLNVLVNHQYQCLPYGEPWNDFMSGMANMLCRYASVKCGPHGCRPTGGYRYIN